MFITEEHYNDFNRLKTNKNIERYTSLVENLIFEIQKMGLPSDDDISLNEPISVRNEIYLNQQHSFKADVE